MSSTNNTPTTARSAPKGTKKSRIVTLRLSPSKLANFPSDIKAKSATPIKPDPSPSVNPSESNDKTSESNSTPLPTTANADTDPNALAPTETRQQETKRRRYSHRSQARTTCHRPQCSHARAGQTGSKEKSQVVSASPSYHAVTRYIIDTVSRVQCTATRSML